MPKNRVFHAPYTLLPFLRFVEVNETPQSQDVYSTSNETAIFTAYIRFRTATYIAALTLLMILYRPSYRRPVCVE